MNKIKIAVVVIIALMAMLAISWVSIPKRIFEVVREHEFVINRSLKEVRRSMVAGDIAKQIIVADGGEVLDKKLINGELVLQKPILQNWQVSGNIRITAKIKEVSEIIFLREAFDAQQDQITAVTVLEKPISNGVTNYQQDVQFRSSGDKTLVTVKIYLRLERKLPSFLQQYVRKKMSQSVDDRIRIFSVLVTQSAERGPAFRLIRK